MRYNHLKKKLDEINDWIRDDVRSQVDSITTQSKYCYNGVVLPFELGDDQDPFIIMNIVSELALSFDTKKRAPFRVVFETVKLSELKNGQFQQSETNEPESTQPDDHEERAIVNEESKELMNIINVTQADDIE